VLGDRVGVGPRRRRPDARGVHHSVLEPRLDAGRLELHPLDGIVQERSHRGHLLGGEVAGAVPDDRVRALGGHDLAATAADGVDQWRRGLGGQPDARRGRSVFVHGGIA
jgi:hypothetical protein